MPASTRYGGQTNVRVLSRLIGCKKVIEWKLDPPAGLRSHCGDTVHCIQKRRSYKLVYIGLWEATKTGGIGGKWLTFEALQATGQQRWIERCLPGVRCT